VEQHLQNFREYRHVVKSMCEIIVFNPVTRLVAKQNYQNQLDSQHILSSKCPQEHDSVWMVINNG